MNYQIHPNKIRQVLLLLFIAFLGIVIIRELHFLLAPLLGAITFYVLLRNWMIALINKYKWKKWLAALTLILGTFIVIVLPFAWLVNFGYQKLLPYINNPSIVQANITNIAGYVNKKININIIDEKYLAKLNDFLIVIGQKFLGGTLSMVSVILMTFLLLYFLLYQTFDVETGLRKHLPFKNKNKQQLIQKTRALIFSNAIGIPITAIVQGVVACIGYWIFGAPDALLFGLLSAITSVIPIVGCMLIYIPLGLFMLSQGLTWQGTGIIVWGLLLIGGIDNVVRFLVQKHLSNVHPLVTIFGVVLGMNLFGFLGIIFGPIILSLFVLFVQIYINEYGVVDADDMPHGQQLQ